MMKKRKHKARRKSRRRSNPVPVIFANPHRKRRKRRRSRARALAPLRRRRRRSRRSSSALAIRHAAPLRRRRSRRTHSARLYRRRHNPGRLSTSKLKAMLGIGLFGGLGIVTARIGGMLYRDHLSKYVLGASPDSTRTTISDLLRIVAMGATTIGGEWGLKRAKVSPSHTLAFKVGGLAEAGRQLVGIGVKKVSPSYVKWGLDGAGRRRAFAGLESTDSFMGALEPADSFDGFGDEQIPCDSDEHPFSVQADY